MATAPRSTAEQDRRAEPNLPTGVLTAATITEPVISRPFLGSSLRWSARPADDGRTRTRGTSDDDHDVAAGHRGRPLCAVDRRLRPPARHRHRGRRPTDGLLARAHARRDVPALRTRLAPGRSRGPHPGGVPGGARHRPGRGRSPADRPVPGLCRVVPAGQGDRGPRGPGRRARQARRPVRGRAGQRGARRSPTPWSPLRESASSPTGPTGRARSHPARRPTPATWCGSRTCREPGC